MDLTTFAYVHSNLTFCETPGVQYSDFPFLSLQEKDNTNNQGTLKYH